MATDAAIRITVKFEGESLPIDDRNAILMAIESLAREKTGRDVRIYMDRLGDDSRLRTLMTPAERAKL